MDQNDIEEVLIKDLNLPIFIPDKVTFKEEQYAEILMMQELIKGYRKLISRMREGGLIINESSLLDRPMIFIRTENKDKLEYKLVPKPL